MKKVPLKNNAETGQSRPECNSSTIAIVSVLFLMVVGLLDCSEKNPTSTISGNPVVGEETGKKILFFGDSLTAGLGLVDPEKEAWPALVGARLRSEGVDVVVWNAGLSGDTTSGGLARLDYSLQKKPDVFVLELGANDSMRGIPIATIRANIETIIDTVQERYPGTPILLVGIKTFPNFGASYRKQFDQIYTEIARNKKLPLVPFLLQGVAGDRSLNQEDGIHPTAQGHKIIAETVYPYLKKILVP